ncbi:methionine--tRNA ligase [archaeon]|jgi:methionyl-tRNA synthetase|nr:methionine--tRNA ligase [archaeon]
MTNKFYITTTIPYANAPPHIGFTLEIVQADVLARWKKLQGFDVFFLTGTDEHGYKNYKTAKEAGISTQKFVDKNSDAFEELTKVLNISNDSFIRTTDQKVHWPGVFEMWKKLEAKGDIYKKKYDGNYCVGCERFVTEKDLVDGKCLDHPNLKIEKISEENYFFKLSKYSDKITELIKKDKLKISPEKWKNDFLGLIKGGLTDVSFSRSKKNLPWGIPVPGDDSQVMYVWCDALTNYLTGIGFPKKKFEKYWPADVHVVGKDMLRFHTGIWPGMLLSAGLPLPKEVIVHGFLTVGGRKMSKSLGNVVAPLEMIKKYPADSIRYALMRATPFGDDGDFSESALVDRHNNELANKLGNLVSRVTGLIAANGIEESKNFLKFDLKKIEKFMENFELDKALNEIFAFVDVCNEYIQSKKPWETKDKKVLYEVADSIKKITILLSPFIPETCERIAKHFGFKLKWDELDKPWKAKKIKKADILFGKIEFNKTGGKINKSSKPEGIVTMEGIVEFGDWEKLDLRVAEVEKVEAIEGADKLWKLSLDVGEVGKRTVCAGLKDFYSDKELKGKKIILFSNLKSRKMRGIESQGMLLAASNKDHSRVVLISPEKDIENGSSVS